MKLLLVLVTAAVAPLAWAQPGRGEIPLLMALVSVVASASLAGFAPPRPPWVWGSDGLLARPPRKTAADRTAERSHADGCVPGDAAPARTHCGLADPDPWDAVARARSERAVTLARWLAGGRRSGFRGG